MAALAAGLLNDLAERQPPCEAERDRDDTQVGLSASLRFPALPRASLCFPCAFLRCRITALPLRFPAHPLRYPCAFPGTPLRFPTLPRSRTAALLLCFLCASRRIPYASPCPPLRVTLITPQAKITIHK